MRKHFQNKHFNRSAPEVVNGAPLLFNVPKNESFVPVLAGDASLVKPVCLN